MAEALSDFDEDVSEDDDTLTVIQAITQYKQEAEDAKVSRMSQNRRNRDAFLGRQDWSHKQPGQSREFLPKTATAIEQMTAFMKRGLIEAGDWFSIDVNPQLSKIIYGSQIVALMRPFLENLWGPNDGKTNIYTVLSDGVRNGLLESLIIMKVHGGTCTYRRFVAEQGDIETEKDGAVRRRGPSLTAEEYDEWRLRIDLVRPEDYFPDPTGNNLYEIHQVERDLHEVLKMAEDGVYDQEAVDRLLEDAQGSPENEDERTDQDRAQDDATPPDFRQKVILWEFWGTLLGRDGSVAHRNCVATVANGRYLVRPPEPNPFWHQESPFVAVPLIRVPWSVWHKALYDSASSLNLALNEVFNLILDGGLASVWGVKQLRVDQLEDPGQVSDGIPQGITLAVKDTLPPGVKVLEQVTEGDVPQDAMAIFEYVNREFTAAALTNETKLGSLPAKQVRATEVMEASQSQAVTLDGIITNLENELIVEVLRKSFLTIMQNADRIPDSVLTGATNMKSAMLIMRAPAEERFALFAGRMNFRVNGLSQTLARGKDFQKMMALMQAVTVNPLLFQSFMARYSADKTLDQMFRSLNINPESMTMSEEEKAASQERQAQLPGIMELLGGPAKGTQGGQRKTTGEPGLQSQVNQMFRPISGMEQ